MTTQKLIKTLEDHSIAYDTERTIVHAYCYAHSDECDTLQVDENGKVLINGRPDSLREWLGY